MFATAYKIIVLRFIWMIETSIKEPGVKPAAAEDDRVKLKTELI
jgi:hypothetical protein